MSDQVNMFGDAAAPKPEARLREGLYTARELRAIRRFFLDNPDCQLTLQARWDRVYYIRKSTGKLETQSLDDVLAAYDAARKEAARERAAWKRAVQKRRAS